MKDYAVVQHGPIREGDSAQGLMHRNAHASVALAMIYAYEAEPTKPPLSCMDPWEMLVMIQAAMTAPLTGCFVEVGVFRGGSAWHLTQLAKKQGRSIYLYDTFDGMPYCDKEDVDGVPEGVLKVTLEEVRQALGPYPAIQKCVFPNGATLPIEPIAFAHIDVDAYRSTKETILALLPLMLPGGIMWFDDSNTLEGCRQAIREVFSEDQIWIDEATKRWFVRFP